MKKLTRDSKPLTKGTLEAQKALGVLEEKGCSRQGLVMWVLEKAGSLGLRLSQSLLSARGVVPQPSHTRSTLGQLTSPTEHLGSEKP